MLRTSFFNPYFLLINFSVIAPYCLLKSYWKLLLKPTMIHKIQFNTENSPIGPSTSSKDPLSTFSFSKTTSFILLWTNVHKNPC